MAYEKNWSSTEPGALIFLLDQSGSMDDKFGGSQIGADKKKCDMVATVLNNILLEFVKANTVGAAVKPRAEVAVIGYGGNGVAEVNPWSTSKPFLNLAELISNPLRIEKRTKKEIDDTGNLVEVPQQFMVWVDPQAAGKTPMTEALNRARDIAQAWIKAHPNNYPPVIVNVTDGAATDVSDMSNPVELQDAARKLTDLSTGDGNCLLFTCHITDNNDPKVEFPDGASILPNASNARVLFEMSSEIPETARKNIKTSTSIDIPKGARGFVFNGDAASVRQMFIFATVQAQQDR